MSRATPRGPGLAILLGAGVLALSALPTARAAPGPAEAGAPIVVASKPLPATAAVTGAEGSGALLGQAAAAGELINQPPPGTTVSIAAIAGQLLILGFDPSLVQVRVDEDGNLVLTFDAGTADEARLVFLGLAGLAGGDNPPVLQIAGVDIGSDVLLGQVVALAATQPGLEHAAGLSAPPGGGGVFGLVPIISWLLHRLDFISAAQARELEQVAGLPDGPLFEQLLAQFQIVREAEVLKAAMAYQADTAEILEREQERIKGGGGNRADVEQARAVHLEAQLEVKDAQYRQVLAFDAHQDEFGKRLLKGAYPAWRDEPPRGLDAIRAAVAPERRKEARRYWRQWQFAEDTKQLLETLSLVAGQVLSDYVEHYAVAQRTLLDVLGARRVLFQTRVRLAQRDYELKSAEAWLLAAIGKLTPDYIRLPGWK